MLHDVNEMKCYICNGVPWPQVKTLSASVIYLATILVSIINLEKRPIKQAALHVKLKK